MFLGAKIKDKRQEDLAFKKPTETNRAEQLWLNVISDLSETSLEEQLRMTFSAGSGQGLWGQEGEGREKWGMYFLE